MYKKCPNCGTSNHNRRITCVGCGYDFTQGKTSQEGDMSKDTQEQEEQQAGLRAYNEQARVEVDTLLRKREEPENFVAGLTLKEELYMAWPGTDKQPVILNKEQFTVVRKLIWIMGNPHDESKT